MLRWRAQLQSRPCPLPATQTPPLSQPPQVTKTEGHPTPSPRLTTPSSPRQPPLATDLATSAAATSAVAAARASAAAAASLISRSSTRVTCVPLPPSLARAWRVCRELVCVSVSLRRVQCAGCGRSPLSSILVLDCSSLNKSFATCGTHQPIAVRKFVCHAAGAHTQLVQVPG